MNKKSMFNAMLNKVNGWGATCLIALTITALTACEKDTVSEELVESKTINFTVAGEFSDRWTPVTRSLTADGKDMTDIWVLDYVGTELQQTIHQDDNTASDFGTPAITLSYGSHHLYFIASRGSGATINTTNHTITFTKVLDNFWRELEINVVATSNTSQVINLNRVVTKLKLSFTDPIAEGAATINIIPHTWYYGMDYFTGEPTAAATDQAVVINIPASEIGNTIYATVYGFSGADEWTTDISINSKKSDNTIIGQATIDDAPFVRNRISEYTGPLFSAGSGMTLTLNTDWSTSYQGSW